MGDSDQRIVLVVDRPDRKGGPLLSKRQRKAVEAFLGGKSYFPIATALFSGVSVHADERVVRSFKHLERRAALAIFPYVPSFRPTNGCVFTIFDKDDKLRLVPEKLNLPKAKRRR